MSNHCINSSDHGGQMQCHPDTLRDAIYQAGALSEQLNGRCGIQSIQVVVSGMIIFVFMQGLLAVQMMSIGWFFGSGRGKRIT